jgi:hypothetical protein
MSDVLLDKARKLEDLFVSCQAKLQATRESINGTEITLADVKQQHTDKVLQLEFTEKAIEVTKILIGELSEKSIRKLQELLTYGMRTIFDDRDYSIEIDIADRGDMKTAELFLVEKKDGEIRKCKLRDSVGGGVQTVVSFILRVYFMLVLGLRRFVILDESLSQLSDVYVEGLFKFIRQCTDDLGFSVLWVTHDVRFTSYATSIYRMVHGDLKKEK